VNVTRNGAQPDELLAVKFATGSCACIDKAVIRDVIERNSLKKTFPVLGIKAGFLKGQENNEFSPKNYLMEINFVHHNSNFSVDWSFLNPRKSGITRIQG